MHVKFRLVGSFLFRAMEIKWGPLCISACILSAMIMVNRYMLVRHTYKGIVRNENKYLYEEFDDIFEGSGRWDDRKELGWKERMDDWKLQQGNLGNEYDELADHDMAMSAPIQPYILFS